MASQVKILLFVASLVMVSADVRSLYSSPERDAQHQFDSQHVAGHGVGSVNSDGSSNSGAANSFSGQFSNEGSLVGVQNFNSVFGRNPNLNSNSNSGSSNNVFFSGPNDGSNAAGTFSNQGPGSSGAETSDQFVFVDGQGNNAFGGSGSSGNRQPEVTRVLSAPRSGILNADLNLGSNVGLQVGRFRTYESHIFPRAGVIQLTTTVTTEVTTTHKLRVPSTSDVWVTDVTMVKVPVTVLTTRRNFSPLPAETATSFIRVTLTEHEILTRTVQVFPTKTFVSHFTQFVTETSTVELWQPVVHEEKQYEVITVPVMETQTLLQHLYTTITVTSAVDVTSVRRS